MKLTSSYAVEIKHINKLFRQTIKIYNDAISFCIKAFEEHWKVLETLDTSNKERFAYADALIHSTKSNDALYPEFDIKFRKMPSYLRFSVINTALGYLSSYHSNLTNWEYSNTDDKAPSLQTHLNKLPTFYKGNMYLDDCDGDAVRLKLFVNNDWNWVKVDLKHTDVINIQRRMQNAKMSVPTLEKKNKKWFLRFAFEEKVDLNKTKLEEQHILAVNLGINTDVTCSVMNMEGAILMCKENQYDAFPSLKCRDCVYCNIRAELDGETVDSHCPINHKEIKLSRPWFASYDVGNGHICKNFAPSRVCKWLYDRWEGLDKYYADMEQILRSDGYSDTQIHKHLPPFNTTISLNLNNNNDMRYYIDMNDYFNCNVSESTNILMKSYMKQTRKSSYGYKRVTEKLNKTIGDILSKKEE